MLKVCKNCGFKNTAENVFCTNCGNRIETSVNPGPRLVILAEKSGNIVFSIKGDRMTIGRDLHNDLVIDDPKISKYHAHIIYENEQAWIEDLNSRNGVYLNGKKIYDKTRVKNGMLIKLGSTILKYEML